MSSAKSKTPSGTTRNAKPHKRPRDPAFQFPPFYLDESVSQTVLPAALQHAGFVVHTRFTTFPDVTHVDDEMWLERCGREGWVALTKDRGIKRRPNERRMFLNAGVRAFVLTVDELTAEQQAGFVLAAIGSMRYRLATTVGPFIVRLAPGPSSELLDLAGSRRPASRDRRRR